MNNKENVSLVTPFFEVYGHDFGYIVHFLAVYGVAKLYAIYKNKINPRQRFATVIPSVFMTILLVIIYRILPHYKIPLLRHLTPSNYILISALAGFLTEELFNNFKPNKLFNIIMGILMWITRASLKMHYGKYLSDADIEKLFKDSNYKGKKNDDVKKGEGDDNDDEGKSGKDGEDDGSLTEDIYENKKGEEEDKDKRGFRRTE